jgi:hypothetical protein
VLAVGGVVLVLVSLALPWPGLRAGVLVAGGVACAAALLEILVSTFQMLHGLVAQRRYGDLREKDERAS